MKRPALRKRPNQQRRKHPGGSGAALVQRLSGALPHPDAHSSARVAEWLAGLKAKAVAKALKSLLREHPQLARLLAGIAEAAPYLWDLVRADGTRFLRLLGGDPDLALAALLAEARSTAAKARARDEVMRVLRGMKAEAALLVALADIGGVWPVRRVTGALTELADTALDIAVGHLLREAVRQEKLTVPDSGRPETGSGYIVLAMGKMGGHELNFSSDIDLMVFFDPAAANFARSVEPATFYVRLTRDLVKLLQERTPDGYVFRVDLRLRPDPSSTQIAMSTEAALDYYERRGQNWERAALIKARPCAGDLAAGAKLVARAVALHLAKISRLRDHRRRP